MEQFFIAMSNTWESFDMVEHEFLTTKRPIVVLTKVHAEARATGRELEFPILQTITVEGQRTTEIHPFYWDMAAITGACTSKEPVSTMIRVRESGRLPVG